MAAITDLAALTAIASGDLLVVHDVSAATDKKITQADLLGGASTTWTPVLAFGGASTGITYGTQLGYYARLGGMLWVSCRLTLTSKGSATGAATITGLPVQPAGHPFALSMTAYALASNVASVSALAINGTTTVNLYYFVASGGTGVASLTDAIFGNTSDIILTGMYRVA